MSRSWLVLAILVGWGLMTFGVGGRLNSLAQQPETSDPAGEASAVATTEILGGEARYLTHVSLDKPIYRPGEQVRVRAVALHHATHRPTTEPLFAVVQVKGPKGEQVASGTANTQDSVFGFQWQIPSGQAGGQYTVHLSYPQLGHAPAERRFEIRAYRPPRLNSQIKFLRDGYGPADEVVATLKTVRAEGGIPTDAAVTIVARVDGQEVYRGQSTVDPQGQCVARFPLPTTIARGEGTLAMVIDDGGVLETASKTIPILLQTVDLQLYPEGGDLVADLENRVYFEAFTPARKPADLAGTVVDDQGESVAQFRSEHEGRGRLFFTPKKGRSYFLRIDEPSGINTEYPLPAVKDEGVILRTAEDTTPSGAPVRVHLTSNIDGTFNISLNKREIPADSRSVQLLAGKTKTLELNAADYDGVLTVTVHNDQGRPLAERLTFRHPAQTVRLSIDADQSQYVPGGKAVLSLQSTDSKGTPISAVVGLHVTDESVLELIDQREQAPRLPVMVLLEHDVRELADAHVYLDAENERAPAAVDLLLGTQGWRRFALINLPEFLKQHGNASRRALALRTAVVADRSNWALRRFNGRSRGRALGLEDRFDFDGDENVKRFRPKERALSKERLFFDNSPEDARRQKKEVAASSPDASADRPVDGIGNKPQEIAQQRAAVREALNAGARAERDSFFLADELREGEPASDDFVAVRVYAHQVRSNRQPGERTDFTETLFWHAGIKTDEQGKATIEFDLNDSVTSFRVQADAFSHTGSLGSASTKIESVEPFYTEPKIPLEVTSGDLIQIPIGIVNATSQPFDSVKLNVSTAAWNAVQTADTNFPLDADSRTRKSLGLRVGKFHGPADLTIQATAGPYADQVTRTLHVQPLGFPIEQTRGGILPANSTVRHQMTIPRELVPGSLSCRVAVHPTPLARMNDALERLIREPNGCFEQTSSSTFPLVMAQQYFMSHAGVDPSLIERSASMLDKGYERLVGFECKSHGFEWFGNDPGHDALTAYGLLEFTEMAKVRPVDRDLLARTRKWLLDQRDGKGGYTRKTHTLHTWIADPDCANAYNTWALLEAGVDADLSTEVDWVRRAAEASSNTYVLALAANIMLRAGNEDAANQLLDRLAGQQSDDGSLNGATTSVVGSGGEALTIETTALALIAWMQRPAYAHHVEKGMTYLADVCKAGRFGSTQSTILALRAIVQYDQLRATPKEPGSLQLFVDGQAVGSPVAFQADHQGVLTLPSIEELLIPGTHQIELRMTGGSNMPYTMSADFHSTQPNSSEQCNLSLMTNLSDPQIDEGDVTEVNVTVVNNSEQALPNPIAIIGIPGGLEVRHDQLKELVKKGSIAAYEVLGREVILYWRSLRAEERVDLPISVVAAVPGRFHAPASRVYQYYTDEHKHWIEGLTVSIHMKD